MIEIKTNTDDIIELGQIDHSDQTVELAVTDAIDSAVTWINKQDAIQIINHLKKEFEI